MLKKVVAVTGANGRLGKALVDEYKYIPLECDVTDLDSVKRAIGLVQPDTIIHCAAVTNVDACETDLYFRALEVNVRGTCNVRSAFEGQVIYISTDYVFDGRDGPYYEDDKPNPVCHYGFTKLWGEEEILEMDYPTDSIVRTTILYDGHKPDFVTSVITKLARGLIFPVTGVLIGSPTNVHHLAEGIDALVQMSIPPRIINIVGKDVISRYEFAKRIAVEFGYPPNHVEVTMIGKTGIALRPRRAGLRTHLAQTLKIPIYSVTDGLKLIKQR